MTEFETVQQGRHAVRALLSKAHKANKAVEGYEDEKAEVDGYTKEARRLLRGKVGLTQFAQVDRLTEVADLIAQAVEASTQEDVLKALDEATVILNEAAGANETVKGLAADRDFEAHQKAKAEKREAEETDFSDEDDFDDYDDYDNWDFEEDDEEDDEEDNNKG